MLLDSICYKLTSLCVKSERILHIIKKELRNLMWKKRLSDRVKNLPSLTKFQKKECLDFWKKYPVDYDSDWCRLYSVKSGIYNIKYIPDNLYYTTIEEYFNDWTMADSIDDKNYYQKLFPSARQPNTVLHIIRGLIYNKDYELIDFDKALQLCADQKKLIFKKALYSDGGYNIFIWDKEHDEISVLSDILKKCVRNNNYICQEFIKQSKDLSQIYPKCINTIRFNTLIFKGKVHCLAAILKMGAGNMEIDNVHWGGCSCGIDEEGRLRKYGSTSNGDPIETHPSGFVFEGFKVPGYFEARELVCKLQSEIGHFRMASWDIAIDCDNKPVLIEVNLKYGNLDFQQWNNGPIFGQLTDEILDEVFKRNK